MEHYQMYIDGEWCDAEDGATLESVNPATGKVWASGAVAGEVEVNRAVDAANRSLRQGPWAEMNATQRGKILRKLGDLISKNAQHLGDIETSRSPPQKQVRECHHILFGHKQCHRPVIKG